MQFFRNVNFLCEIADVRIVFLIISHSDLRFKQINNVFIVYLIKLAYLLFDIPNQVIEIPSFFKKDILFYIVISK